MKYIVCDMVRKIKQEREKKYERVALKNTSYENQRWLGKEPGGCLGKSVLSKRKATSKFQRWKQA